MSGAILMKFGRAPATRRSFVGMGLAIIRCYRHAAIVVGCRQPLDGQAAVAAVLDAPQRLDDDAGAAQAAPRRIELRRDEDARLPLLVIRTQPAQLLDEGAPAVAAATQRRWGPGAVAVADVGAQRERAAGQRRVREA